jgi:uncharacterized protein DUF4198
MKYRILISGALLLGTAVALHAHDLFIKMDSYHLRANTPVRVPILNGTFQGSVSSVTADRVADVSIASGGRRVKVSMELWSADSDTTFLDIRTGDPGTYVLGVSTLPRDLGLRAIDFNTYLAVDGIPDVLVERARDRELDKDVREKYSKHIKAVYQVGERRSSGVDEVFGHPAELVPLTNPYSLSVGDEIAFRVLVDGEPVRGQLVLAAGLNGSREIEERSERSDGDGVVRFTLDSPGRWYAKFINMRKSDEDGIDYESKWATLSFEIR